ncbi:MAG: hypothetical protein HYU66_09460 [Armatimonadetes bacterium]|nr:hypothetical protein [Armatimonadota bacterium]
MRATLCLLAVLLAVSTLHAADYVWLESEQAAASTVELKPAGWGRAEFLSGGTWCQVGVEADKVEATLPADGYLLSYKVELPRAGEYEVWNRLGYEFVRSPFDWRIDQGEWRRSGPDELTTDPMELQTWNEVAWLKLGRQQLAAGPHQLDIRLPHTKDKDGKPARILYASDAVLFHLGAFHPNGPHKPDEEYRTDADRQAAEHVFRLAAPAAPGARSSLALNGAWEVARDDEQLPIRVDEPIGALPEHPFWTAIQVPSDKNTVRPDLLFAHRLWYRTRFELPAALAGRGRCLTFPQNSLNTTVYLNGRLCGFEPNPFCRFSVDLSLAAKAGVNELVVGIRDAWYAFSSNPDDPMKLRRRWNLPLDFSHQGFQDLAYPVWNHFESGILATPTLTSCGSVYVADAFCRPSVAEQKLAVTVTLRNPGAAPVRGSLEWAAVDDGTGEVAQRFQPVAFEAAAGESTVELSREWPQPQLWWPDDPHLYRLRTTVTLAGQPADVAEQTFGFREWGIRGNQFTLNGLVWHGWADIQEGATPDEFLTRYRQSHQQMMRFWGVSWQGMNPSEALDWFDRHGVVVRRSGMLDGEAIGYMPIEQDQALQKLHGSDLKMNLLQHWREQLTAQIRGERNHPSIMIWSMENEFLYINCINLWGGLMDRFEAEVTKVSDAVGQVDPTRPRMVDGGGACKANTLPVHGDHYVFEPSSTAYPELAYQPNTKGGGRGRWEWDQQRPRFIGEDFYANGINPADYALFGGEEAFLGKAQTRSSIALLYAMLGQGYRWAGYGAFHFWGGREPGVDQYTSFSPLAVFCREWDWSFPAGARVPRKLAIFNDTRFADPITFTWSLSVGEKRLAGDTSTHTITPGEREELSLTLPLPAAAQRTEAELRLRLSQRGAEAFLDRKAVSILPAPAGPAGPKPAANASPALAVFDPDGGAAAYLKAIGRSFAAVTSLADLPAGARVLLVGRHALDVRAATSSALSAWASEGRAVVVLEQAEPLRYQGLPADAETTGSDGSIAFAEDLGHPLLAGLAQKDFFTWSPGGLVYDNAYRKPTRGARSLVQCGPRLANSALLEVPCGKGVILCSQLRVGAAVGANAVARRLLANLLDCAASYRVEVRPAAACLAGNPLLPGVLDGIGLRSTAVESPVAALGGPNVKLLVVTATPEHLRQLAAAKAQVDAFNARGGYLVLLGLAPDGLADFNKLVGCEHLIRPFRRERVQLAVPRHPLTAGLSTGDVVMLSGERIFGWTSDEYVADDEFSYVLDLDDVAPFAKYPSDYFLNMVNGMVSADAWKYIFSFEKPSEKPPVFTLELPRPETIEQLDWIGNAFYHLVTEVRITFDGKDTATFATQPNNELQTFALQPPRRGQSLTVALSKWQVVAGKGDVVGVDNLWLHAQRPADFRQRVKPLLNVGAIVDYPRGKGGLLLCNLNFKERETVPVNATKKRAILAALLRNLAAPFSGGKTIIAGARLAYEPVDIAKQCNQFRNEKGWFGDAAHSFAALPTGRQTFGGVPFEVYDFPTSPVPNCVMLGARGVPGNLPERVAGIPVGKKLDALFFLQAARLDQRRDPRERRENKPYEMARYVVHYADGQTATVPVIAEVDIDDYRQPTPQPLPGAQIGWTRPYGDGSQAVAYVQQWNNPRPEVAIASVGLEYGEARRGPVALLAMTGAKGE